MAVKAALLLMQMFYRSFTCQKVQLDIAWALATRQFPPHLVLVCKMYEKGFYEIDDKGEKPTIPCLPRWRDAGICCSNRSSTKLGPTETFVH